jgi:hypothetical protein
LLYVSLLFCFPKILKLMFSSACISSIMRTIVSVNLTRSIDETWILIEVGAWW